MDSVMNEENKENKNLNKEKIESVMNEEKPLVCVLCQEDIEGTETIIKTSCGHSFHALKEKKCWGLYQHLLINEKCPVCRKNLRSIEHDNEETELHIPNSSQDLLNTQQESRAAASAKKKMCCIAICIIMILIIVISSTLGLTLNS
jgi:hypothetical protein